MTDYAGLQTLVSRDLSDPDRQTFDVDAVKDFIQQGLATVARSAPQQFQEDITGVNGTTNYLLRSATFASSPVPEIRLVRVELWRGGPPARFVAKVKSKAGQPTRDSTAGWEVWNGTLEIPQGVSDSLQAGDLLRVWGYSPYPPVSADADVIPVSAELELVVRQVCRVEGMRKLIGSRVLFKQWQTRSNNTDVTMGQLNSDLQAADEQLRRLLRAIKVPEQNPD